MITSAPISSKISIAFLFRSSNFSVSPIKRVTFPQHCNNAPTFSCPRHSLRCFTMFSTPFGEYADTVHPGTKTYFVFCFSGTSFFCKLPSTLVQYSSPHSFSCVQSLSFKISNGTRPLFFSA